MDQGSRDFRAALQRAVSADRNVDPNLPILPGQPYSTVANMLEREAEREVVLLFQREREIALTLLVNGFLRAAANVGQVVSALG